MEKQLGNEAVTRIAWDVDSCAIVGCVLVIFLIKAQRGVATTLTLRAEQVSVNHVNGGKTS